MKKSAFFILSLAIFITSCCTGDDDSHIAPVAPAGMATLDSEGGMSYSNSLYNWTALKDANGNSYIYQTTLTSWAGFGSTTEIKVQNGSVTSRIYQEFDLVDGQKHFTDTYSETTANLGSHERGAEPLTIDELYSTCASEYLVVDASKNIIQFETAPEGLMTLCGFVPKNCADDCFVGLIISSFVWL